MPSAFDIRGKLTLSTEFKDVEAGKLSKDIEKHVSNIEIKNIKVSSDAIRGLWNKLQSAVNIPLTIKSENIQIEVGKWKAVNIESLAKQINDQLKSRVVDIGVSGKGAATSTLAGGEAATYREVQSGGGDPFTGTFLGGINEKVTQLGEAVSLAERLKSLGKKTQVTGKESVLSGKEQHETAEKRRRTIEETLKLLKEQHGIDVGLTKEEETTLTEGGATTGLKELGRLETKRSGLAPKLGIEEENIKNNIIDNRINKDKEVISLEEKIVRLRKEGASQKEIGGAEESLKSRKENLNIALRTDSVLKKQVKNEVDIQKKTGDLGKEYRRVSEEVKGIIDKISALKSGSLSFLKKIEDAVGRLSDQKKRFERIQEKSFVSLAGGGRASRTGSVDVAAAITEAAERSDPAQLGDLEREIVLAEKMQGLDKARIKSLQIIGRTFRGTKDINIAVEEMKKLGLSTEEATKHAEFLVKADKEIVRQGRIIAAETKSQKTGVAVSASTIGEDEARTAFAKGGALASILGKSGDLIKAGKIDEAYKAIEEGAAKAGKKVRDELGAKAGARFAKDNVFSRLQSQVKRYASYAIVSGAAFKLRSELRELITTTIEFERTMVDVTKVMNVTATEITQLKDAARSFGQEFGFSLKEVSEAMTVYAQQGKSVADTIALTRNSALLANVSTLSLKDATEALTAATQQFNISAKDSIGIIDAWNEVANNHAVTEADMFEAIKRSGSAAKESGVSFNALAGYVTALQSRTRRGGKIIGTTLKTLFSKLNTDKAIKAFRKVGIATFDLGGDFRKAEDRIGELAKAWETLSSVQRNNIAFAVAGRRKYAQFLALMQGFDEAVEATRDATYSQGSAFEEQEKIMDSLDKKIKVLGATWESMTTKFAESGLTDVLKTAVSVVTELTKALGGLSGSSLTLGLGGIAAAGTFAAGRSLFAGYSATSLGGSKPPEELAKIKAAKITDAFSATISKATVSIKRFAQELTVRKVDDGYAAPKETAAGRFGTGAYNLATSRAGVVGGGLLISTIASSLKEGAAKGLTEVQKESSVGVQAYGAVEVGGGVALTAALVGATAKTSALLGLVTAVGIGLYKWVQYATDFTKELREAQELLKKEKNELKEIKAAKSELLQLEKEDLTAKRLQKQIELFNKLAKDNNVLSKYAKEYMQVISSGESGINVIEKAEKEKEQGVSKIDKEAGMLATRAIIEQSRYDAILAKIESVTKHVPGGITVSAVKMVSSKQESLKAAGELLAGDDLSEIEKTGYRDIIIKNANLQLGQFKGEAKEIAGTKIESKEDVVKVLSKAKELEVRGISTINRSLASAETGEAQLQQLVVKEEFQKMIKTLKGSLEGLVDITATKKLLARIDEINNSFKRLSSTFNTFSNISKNIVGQLSEIESISGISLASTKINELTSSSVEMAKVLDKVNTKNLASIPILDALLSTGDVKGVLTTEGGKVSGVGRQIAAEYTRGGKKELSGTGRLMAAAIRSFFGPKDLAEFEKDRKRSLGEGDATTGIIKKSKEDVKSFVEEFNDLFKTKFSATDIGKLVTTGQALDLGGKEDKGKAKKFFENLRKTSVNYSKDLKTMSDKQKSRINILSKDFEDLSKATQQTVTDIYLLAKAEEAVADTQMQRVGLGSFVGVDKSKIIDKKLKITEALELNFKAKRGKEILKIEKKLYENRKEQAAAALYATDSHLSKEEQLEELKKKGEQLAESFNQTKIKYLNEEISLTNRKFAILKERLSDIVQEVTGAASARAGLFTADPTEIYKQKKAAETLLQLVGPGTKDASGTLRWTDEQKQNITAMSRSSRSAGLAGLDLAAKTSASPEMREIAKELKRQLFMTEEEIAKIAKAKNDADKALKAKEEKEAKIVKLREANANLGKTNQDSFKTNLALFGKAILSFKTVSDKIIEYNKGQQKTTKEIANRTNIGTTDFSGGEYEDLTNFVKTFYDGYEKFGDLTYKLFDKEQRGDLTGSNTAVLEALQSFVQELGGNKNITMNFDMDKVSRSFLVKLANYVKDGVLDPQEKAELLDEFDRFQTTKESLK